MVTLPPGLDEAGPLLRVAAGAGRHGGERAGGALPDSSGSAGFSAVPRWLSAATRGAPASAPVDPARPERPLPRRARGARLQAGEPAARPCPPAAPMAAAASSASPGASKKSPLLLEAMSSDRARAHIRGEAIACCVPYPRDWASRAVGLATFRRRLVAGGCAGGCDSACAATSSRSARAPRLTLVILMLNPPCPLAGYLRKRNRHDQWQKRFFEVVDHYFVYYKRADSPDMLCAMDLYQADPPRVLPGPPGPDGRPREHPLPLSLDLVAPRLSGKPLLQQSLRRFANARGVRRKLGSLLHQLRPRPDLQGQLGRRRRAVGGRNSCRAACQPRARASAATRGRRSGRRRRGQGGRCSPLTGGR